MRLGGDSMTAFDVIVGRCSMRMSSPLMADECKRRLDCLPDFATTEVGVNKIALQKNTGRPYLRLRRAPPPVVHATFVPLEVTAAGSMFGRAYPPRDTECETKAAIASMTAGSSDALGAGSRLRG
jgi:hypothetical protein